MSTTGLGQADHVLRHMIDIDETLNLTQGQGHKVKGQGHIHLCKNLFSAINHEWMIVPW